MNELLALFVTEARDLLREAGEDLLALERAPDNEDAVNRLFRSVHTLKGSSGLFDVPPLTQVLHAAEDIFMAVREHRLAMTPAMVDVSLKALDQVGLWIDQLDQHEVLRDDAVAVSQAAVKDLRDHFGGQPHETALGADAAAPHVHQPPPPAMFEWFDDATLRTAAGAGADGLLLVSYVPDDGCFFRGEDPLHLVLQIPLLQGFDMQPKEPWPALADVDPFACNLAFHALSTASRSEVETLFRYVPEQVTILQLDPAALLPAEPAAIPSLVLDGLLRWQIDMLELWAEDDAFAGRVASATGVAANALRFHQRPGDAALIDAAGADALRTRTIDPLIAALGLLSQPAAPAADIANDPIPVEKPAAAEAADRSAPRTLRVDQEKVDALINLIGELVVAKNGLPFLARRAEQQYGLRDLGREIKDQYGVIDRIAQELRGAVMAVRMMPVGQVFQRFPRLVRDLSRKLGKQVDLVIEGEATEADKNVIESLFDPILHMVRNSLDHGVETPEQRTACGKTETATVRLLARHDGDHVVIEVIDDGRGIDPVVIKNKAYERGLLDEARLATISDQDATMLVFAAGFSTAETISDVSGRGVGMDVVRNAVEKAGGRISMTSVKGSGTTVRLNLPLSMAVSRVMTVTLDDRLFGIPMDLIHGTVKVARTDVVKINGSEAFVLRDRVVPLLHLSRLLDLPDAAEPPDDVAVLVVQVGGQTIGLGISAFGEGMEVILKPLEGMLAKIVGYTGTALLGDGRVLLVLDLKELVQ
jgi:two-component system chemotaxis sensor kinase CheA